MYFARVVAAAIVRASALLASKASASVNARL